jgi:phosphocarrier protein
VKQVTKEFIKPSRNAEDAPAPAPAAAWTPHRRTEEQAMPTKSVTVGSALGLHARPAAIIAESVVNAGVPVTLSMDGGEPVDAGSALMIMTLGAGNGAAVTVASDDEEALATVAELVQQDLDA